MSTYPWFSSEEADVAAENLGFLAAGGSSSVSESLVEQHIISALFSTGSSSFLISNSGSGVGCKQFKSNSSPPLKMSFSRSGLPSAI
jgi:hypothetical protein